MVSTGWEMLPGERCYRSVVGRLLEEGGRVREDGQVGGRRVRYVFFQAEDGIRDYTVTGVQTCALPICLIGGDVILSFDGQPIHNEDQLNALMARTPIGKVVDVEYMRDGEKKTTKLTTISLPDNEIGRASCRERV